MKDPQAVSDRLARTYGLHASEVYLVLRLRDRALVAIYSREVGWLWRLQSGIRRWLG